jgi:superfamily I DNA/RNA helicase
MARFRRPDRAHAAASDAPDIAQWVLFRLDGGIDHILVDEAQDTSPAQWDIVKRLAEDFAAGEGARAEVSARSSSSATRSSRSIPSRAPIPRASTACATISTTAFGASA